LIEGFPLLGGQRGQQPFLIGDVFGHVGVHDLLALVGEHDQEAAPHYHANSSELFFVIGGSVQLLADDRVITAGAGDLVVPHPEPDAPTAHDPVSSSRNTWTPETQHRTRRLNPELVAMGVNELCQRGGRGSISRAKKAEASFRRAGLVADRAAQLPAQHRVLVPQHEQFRVLRRIAAKQY
jgi:hypothetical protein